MNFGTKIGFNKSSLLSLKAELARKHEEANHAKAHYKNKPTKPLSKPAKTTNNKSSVDVEDGRDIGSIEDTSDPSKLHSSKQALEAKARLYEKLSENPANVTEGAPYLVDFSKKSEASNNRTSSKEEEDEDEKRIETDSDDYDAPSDPEDDWVDYTDCLGRTRRCLRRDLADLKARDAEFYESTKRESSPAAGSAAGTVPAEAADNLAPHLVSDDMRRAEQRKIWEQEEERIKNKADVHYQDVLFNEARQHGVGYFSFSTDDAERRAQQAELKNLRTETEKQQAATNAARQRRGQLLNKRLRAAHNRKRARDGLPPLRDDEELPVREGAESPPPEPEPPQIQTAADPAKRGERVPPIPSVRPWDVGKEGVTERPVMTQDEWVREKRKDRHKEFAPPSFYEDRNPSEGLARSASHYDQSESYSKKKKRKLKEEPNRKRMEEVEDFTEGDVETLCNEKPKSSRRGVEIPPPLSMDYFGPGSKSVEASRKRGGMGTSRGNEAELEKSISAGLSFLRQQQEEKEKQREKGMLDIL